MAPKTRKRILEDPDSAEIHVSLLSDFGVESGGGRIQFPAVGARLIAYLALARRPITRSAIAGTLWPETTQEKAQASLRSTLWRVRRVNDRLVRAAHDCLALEDSVGVDTHALLDASQRLSEGSGVDGSPGIAISRLSSELLPDWYDNWVVYERERFRLMALRALEAMAESYTENGSFAAAVECALGAVRLEPLRESAHRSLIVAHIGHGNLSEAVRQYRSYRDLLRVELGVEPSRHMIALLDSAGLRRSVVNAA